MRVVLAYPWNGHAPDEEVDIEVRDAKRLLRDGKARMPEGEPAAAEPVTTVAPQAPTAAEVKAYAKEQGITTAQARKQIAAALAEKTRATPPEGDNPKEDTDGR